MELNRLILPGEYNCEPIPDGIEINAIENDGRKITPGCLFFCHAGSRYDSHAYLPTLADAGCAAAVVASEKTTDAVGIPVIQVANTRRAEAFAVNRNHRIPRFEGTRDRLRRVPHGRRGDHDHAAHPNALSSARGNGGGRDHARRDRGVLAIPCRVPRRAALFLPRDLYKPISRASRSPQDHERLSAGEKDPVQTDRNRDRQRELPVVGSVARRSFLPSDRLRRPS